LTQFSYVPLESSVLQGVEVFIQMAAFDEEIQDRAGHRVM